jgi:hypothetical protein
MLTLFSLVAMDAHRPLTLIAIWWSLRPPSPPDVGNTTPRGVLCRFLADPSTALDEAGRFALPLPYCSRLASPFILYRLKGLGFSACRIHGTAGGLLVEGRR